MPNFEKRPKQAFEKSEESIAERREETAETAIAGDSEKPQREAMLKQQAQEQQTHDSQEAGQLLERLKNKYGERYTEERGLKPGDEVYTDGHLYRIENNKDALGRAAEAIDPLLKPPGVEMREKELDTQLEMATRAGLSGGSSGGESIGVLPSSPLERRASDFDLEKRIEEGRKREEHEGAQSAVSSREFHATILDDVGPAEQKERVLRAGDVTKATPELKERLKEMKGRNSWWKGLNPFQ